VAEWPEGAWSTIAIVAVEKALDGEQKCGYRAEASVMFVSILDDGRLAGHRFFGDDKW